MLKQTLNTSVEVVHLTTALCAKIVTGMCGDAQLARVGLPAHECMRTDG